MPSENETQVADDFGTAIAGMEQAAEERFPGVLDLLEAYSQVGAVVTAWRPVNAAVLGYGIGTTPERTLA